MSSSRVHPTFVGAVIWTGIAIATSSTARADNPIVQTNYTADPAPMVHDGKIYLYTSHDEDVTVNGFFTMNDWRVYSTTDVVNWTDHGSPLSYKTFSWAKGDAWAGQCVPRNGKFYWYVPLGQKSGGQAIGVAVSDSPTGPFTDPLGKRLVSTSTGDIDPTVFIDEGGQAYLYWGNPKLWYVKLNADMISYAGSPVEVPLTTAAFGRRSKTDRATAYEEGPWFYRRDSRYYLLFAANGIPEQLSYATSSNPTGPWTFGGVIMEPVSSFTNHPGVVDFAGNSYLFYHNADLPGGGGFKRSVAVEQFTYRPDGTIPPLKPSKGGPPGVGHLDPYVTIEAETIAWESGIETEVCSEGGMNVTSIDNGDYIKVKGVDFRTGALSFEARVASSTGGGSIELRLDSVTGTLVGTCSIQVTGSAESWATRSCTVSGATGIHDLFLKFTGTGRDLFKFNWWRFTPKDAVPDAGPADSGATDAGYSGSGGSSGTSGRVSWDGGSDGSVAGRSDGTTAGNGNGSGVTGAAGRSGAPRGSAGASGQEATSGNAGRATGGSGVGASGSTGRSSGDEGDSDASTAGGCSFPSAPGRDGAPWAMLLWTLALRRRRQQNRAVATHGARSIRSPYLGFLAGICVAAVACGDSGAGDGNESSVSGRTDAAAQSGSSGTATSGRSGSTGSSGRSGATGTSGARFESGKAGTSGGVDAGTPRPGDSGGVGADADGGPRDAGRPPIAIPRGRPSLHAAKTTFVADNGELLRGPFTSSEWGDPAPRDQIAKMKELGFNALHLYAECFDKKYPAPGSTAPGYSANRIDRIVKDTRELGLYLVITIGNGANNGDYNRAYVKDFWTFYAPRYAKETHVIYEIQNEPVGWSPPYVDAANKALDMEVEAYKLIRTHAPDTPVLLFSYSVLWGSGAADAALRDIRAFNQGVFGGPDATWSNLAVAFHGYAGAQNTADAVSAIMKAGYPTMMTEYHGGMWGSSVGGLDVEQTFLLERLEVSWLSFVYVPPWGVSDDVSKPEVYKERVAKTGLSWTPDFGTFPAVRGTHGNQGRPWATPAYVDGKLSGSLRIQAEDFDEGGKGVAYNNDHPTAAQQYRTVETVRIATTSDTSGDYHVETTAGEWHEYTLMVSGGGLYEVRLRMAGQGTVRVLSRDEDLSGPWALTSSGSTSTWGTATKTMMLPGGLQRLRIAVEAGAFNLNWIELAPVSTGPVANGQHAIRNVGNSQSLGLDGSDAVVSGSNATSWALQHVGGGQYTVGAKAQFWTTFMRPLHLTPSWGAERFILWKTGNNYRIVHTGGGLCLQPSTKEAPKMELAACGSGTNQQWVIQ